MGDTSAVRRDGRILPPFVSRFAIFWTAPLKKKTGRPRPDWDHPLTPRHYTAMIALAQ